MLFRNTLYPSHWMRHGPRRFTGYSLGPFRAALPIARAIHIHQQIPGEAFSSPVVSNTLLRDLFRVAFSGCAGGTRDRFLRPSGQLPLPQTTRIARIVLSRDGLVAESRLPWFYCKDESANSAQKCPEAKLRFSRRPARQPLRRAQR